MNSVEAIGPVDAYRYSGYNAYQPAADGMSGMSQPATQAPTMAQMAQQLIMAMVVLSLLSQAFSQQNGGGNPFSGGSQQPSDPFQQFLQNLFDPPQQGGGSDGLGGADGGQASDNGINGNGYCGNGYDGHTGGSGGATPGAGDKDHGCGEAGGHHASSPGISPGKSQPGDKPDQNPCSTPGTNPSPTDGPSGPGKTGGSGETGSPTQITPSTRIPQPNGEVIVHEPIVVKAGQTFDGGGKLYKAGPELGDGGQSESQKPIFDLEPGATLQNVQVQGADGVHANGDANLKNVWWRDVGEDAFTLKKPGNVTVEGGGAFNASDKVFQINAPGSISIDGFHAENFDKLVRQNGNQDFPLTVSLSNITTQAAGEALVRTDSAQCKIYLSNVDPSTVKNDVLAPSGALVEGAVSSGYKPYTG